MDAARLLAEIDPFHRQQRDRCREVGIDVAPLPIGHHACRTRTWAEYVSVRDDLERWCSGNLENVWNGRPISRIALPDPVRVEDGQIVELVELIPPFHQRVYRMGLEHIGFGVGDDFDDFATRHHDLLTGQQFQGPTSAPLYRLFAEDYAHVKFHRISLGDACRLEGRNLDSIVHAEWRPADQHAGPYEVW